MVLMKVLWFTSQHCLGTFTMLLVKGFSQTGLFRHFSDYVFGVRNFEIRNSERAIFFFKMFKISSHLDFKNAAKNSEKFFCFWDNCIWIGIVKLSLLRRGYFSPVGNVLNSGPKIWDVNNGNFFQLNWLESDQWIRQRCCDADFNSPWARLPYCLSKAFLK